PAANGSEPAGDGHTAPHDELLAVARELLAHAPERTVSIDALSNALKARGFRRTPGSPRLITRLRRIKELEVGRTGAVRLVEPGPAEEPAAHGTEEAETAERSAGEPEAASAAADTASPPTPGKRRRRRRGRRDTLRVGLGFATADGTRIVLELRTAGPPLPAFGGLTDPLGHAPDVLPIMYRDASAAAAPGTRLTIGGEPCALAAAYYTEGFATS